MLTTPTSGPVRGKRPRKALHYFELRLTVEMMDAAKEIAVAEERSIHGQIVYFIQQGVIAYAEKERGQGEEEAGSKGRALKKG